MTSSRVQRAGLDVATELADFVEQEALESSKLSAEEFWQAVADLIHDLTPRNRDLLEVRDRLQARLDEYHTEHPGQPDPQEYRRLLEDMGYLLPAPDEFEVSTEGVDEEIATVGGPQLVVPMLNARFAINAANARWGSLYDALYGSDVIPDEGETRVTKEYNVERGNEVIRRGRELLDSIAPLTEGSHADASAYRVRDGSLVVSSTSDAQAGLVDGDVFAGHTGDAEQPDSILLRHHGLYVEIVVDPENFIGKTDSAGVADIVLEAALTSIMDLEDSVAAVDAEDKVLGYRNWRGLVSGALTEEVTKGEDSFTRRMAKDRTYTAPDGSSFTVPGRSLMLVRNVGHLMTTDAVRDRDGQEVQEGLLDAVMTALCAMPDLYGDAAGTNSRRGSVYIVKPKMHGPDEVAFTGELFGRVETLLGLPHGTLKMGIMDEERRTSVNLRACIHAARDRVAFINTGFLDRTGDEIHTSLQAGVMVPKGDMKDEPFLGAYERSNVDAGLEAGLLRRGQIGKGMWAMPNQMADMLEQKIGHLKAGATTAWVPSPTAATLHALHYHQVDVFEVADELTHRSPEPVDDLLVLPLAEGELSREVIETELDNNVQSILGYVVRWVDQGVGCSKVPDIHGTALMEDRATLRISSQLLANWLRHGVISEEELDSSLRRLAAVVDEQNAGDPTYEPLLSDGGPGVAYQAARRLVTEGAEQPAGYTEPLLHGLRREKKAGAR
ncbi:MAG: malate synthase G [Ornithinimicrobium sp.]